MTASNAMPRISSALVAAETRLGLNETLGLSGSLRAAVHDIEAKLKEIDDPRTTSWMLMMRRHEKDFMLRRDPKYIAEVKKAAVEFSKAIEVVAVPTAVMNDITAKLQKYQSEFAAWAETAQQSAALDASMMKTFRELEPSMVEVRTAVDAMYKQADAAEAATRDAVRMWMMIAFAHHRRRARRGRLSPRALDLEGAVRHGRCDDAAGARRAFDLRPRHRAQGRDRRDGRCGRGVQDQHGGGRAAACGAGRG